MAPSSLFLKAGAVVVAALTTSAAALQAPGPYEKHDVYEGQTFFDQWDFFTGVDPTHGFVDYKGRADAQSQGLINVNAKGQAYMGVDYATKYSQDARGRASVRVESKKKYNGGLFIADIAHMPGSICGVWPAFWTVGLNDWPNDGEIDILENMNEATVNIEALHTSKDCVLSSDAQGGSLRTAHCSNAYTDGFSQWPNQGCSTTHTDASNSYGSGFNSQGGAIYAMEWDAATIKIWMLGRNSVDGLDALSANPNPSNWGKPTLSTAASTCDIPSLFKNHTMIFDTTFCGDYAGQDIFWQQTSCYKSDPNKYSTCAQYVASQPSAYENAFWLVNHVHVYQRSSNSVSSTSSTTVASSTTTSTSSTSSSTAVSSTSSTTASSTSSTAASSSSSTAASSSSSTSASSSSSTAASSTSSTSASSSSSTAASSTSSTSASSTSSTAASSTSSTSASSTSSTAASSSSSTAVSSTSSTTASSTSSTAASSTSSTSASSTSSTAVSSTSTVESSSYTSSAPITTGPSTTPILSSSSGPYSNSSVPTYPTLTSTIITTSVYTITSCAPTVTSCTKGQVITATITDYTTYCPGPRSTSSPVPTSKPAQLTTSTVYATSVITITKCPVTVTSCPAESTVVVTSTYALYTTVCPVDSLPTKPAGPGPKFPFSSSIPAAPANPTTPVVVVVTKPVIPVPPSQTAPYGGNGTAPANPTSPVVVVVTKPVIPVQASQTAAYGGNGTAPAGPISTGKPVTTIKIVTTPVAAPTSSNKPVFTGAAVRLGTSISALVGVAAMAILL